VNFLEISFWLLQGEVRLDQGDVGHMQRVSCKEAVKGELSGYSQSARSNDRQYSPRCAVALLATKSEPNDRTKRDPQIVVLAVIEVNRIAELQPQPDRPQT
jgi:hypothetical protein